MTSRIRVNRICQCCGAEFEAKTTVTKYCGDTCAKKAYKIRVRSGKIEASNKEVLSLKIKPLQEIQAKEFLTVKDVAKLLNSSVRTVYNLISEGKVKAVNLSKRKTLVKRSDIDKIFF